ncbi:MAG: hypothetical protein D6826_11795, partial [Alphaproteobacteria bacterium]
MQIGVQHWAVAVLVAVLVHAGVATAVVWQVSGSGVESAGRGGIEVSLGSIGEAPGSVAPAASEVPEAEMVVPGEATARAPVRQAAAVPPDPAPLEMVKPVEAGTTAPSKTFVKAVPAEMVEAGVEGETFALQPVGEAAAVEVMDLRPAGKEVQAAKLLLPEDMRAPAPGPATAQPQEEIVAKAVITVPPPSRPKPRPPMPPEADAMPEPVLPRWAQEP